jgi:hypothetical protein
MSDVWLLASRVGVGAEANQQAFLGHVMSNILQEKRSSGRGWVKAAAENAVCRQVVRTPGGLLGFCWRVKNARVLQCGNTAKSAKIILYFHAKLEALDNNMNGSITSS